jgi:hypothetical protein
MIHKLEALFVTCATTVAVTGLVNEELISHKVGLIGAAADIGAGMIFVMKQAKGGEH